MAWLSEWLRRWSNKPDVVGSIPVTTEFVLISCDSNQVPKWFGTQYNLGAAWCRTGYISMGPLCGLRLVQNYSQKSQIIPTHSTLIIYLTVDKHYAYL